MFTSQPFRLQKHLWLPATSLSERLDCIHSMYSVYSDYVANSKVEIMENCFYMWWDWVASTTVLEKGRSTKRTTRELSEQSPCDGLSKRSNGPGVMPLHAYRANPEGGT